METFLDIIRDNGIGILSLVVGVIGLGVGLYSHRSSKKVAKPIYEVSSLAIFASHGNDIVPSEATISFEGNQIKNLTREQIRFWNGGNETLRGTDIAKRDPLRIVVDSGVRILMHKIRKQPRDVNGVSLQKQQPNELLLNYDFLDPKDGVAIDIWHDGKESIPEIQGAIQGIPEGVKKISGGASEGRSKGKITLPWIRSIKIDDLPLIRSILAMISGSRSGRVHRFMSLIMSILIIISGLVMLLLGIGVFFFEDPADGVTYVPTGIEGIGSVFLEAPTDEPSLIAILGIIYLLMGVRIWRRSRRRYPKELE